MQNINFQNVQRAINALQVASAENFGERTLDTMRCNQGPSQLRLTSQPRALRLGSGSPRIGVEIFSWRKVSAVVGHPGSGSFFAHEMSETKRSLSNCKRRDIKTGTQDDLRFVETASRIAGGMQIKVGQA